MRLCPRPTSRNLEWSSGLGYSSETVYFSPKDGDSFIGVFQDEGRLTR